MKKTRSKKSRDTVPLRVNDIRSPCGFWFLSRYQEIWKKGKVLENDGNCSVYKYRNWATKESIHRPWKISGLNNIWDLFFIPHWKRILKMLLQKIFWKKGLMQQKMLLTKGAKNGLDNRVLFCIPVRNTALTNVYVIRVPDIIWALHLRPRRKKYTLWFFPCDADFYCSTLIV